MVSSDRIAKIKWNCRRGMLELDLLLERFLAYQFNDLTEHELLLLEELLKLQDPDLYHCLMFDEAIVDEKFSGIVSKIKACH
tara:strand:- start:269 stop:514 length:246 start_codon:yes stop_codon:yes gene_type:complete